MKKAEARATLSGEALKQAVDTLYQQNPKDGHVHLFLGEVYAANREPDKAQSFYESAIDMNPKLAEAHYVLGLLFEQQGHLNSARVEYLKAIGLSPESKYQNSLATIYFKQEKYESAIKEYGKNLEYPLSSLESAKIFWRLGYLSQALAFQSQAVDFLENAEVMSHPENQDAWFIEASPERVIKLSTLEEKKSYAYLSLSATLFLHGNSDEAEKQIQKVRSLKLRNQSDINKILQTNLDTLFKADTDIVESVEAFKKSYL